ncbi:MAG: type 4a pilus biogenesis protein PilO [Planctomycetes bacterium]|nr:type 4a pilus biogenesis protein PilO [Planctomycetota bacterium]
MNIGVRGAMLIGIVVGMPVASYFLVFKPQNKAIAAAKKEVDHKAGLLAKLREETARNADLARANEEIQRSVKTIEARLPSGKELDGLVRQVSDLAVASGLQPPAMKSAKPVPAALYMEQPIEMEVLGNFVGFFTFLAHIEKLPRITRIHDLKISGMARDDVELKAEFTLSIYFQDDKPLAQGATQ